MRLRTRFSDLIKTRLTQSLGSQSPWNNQSVLVSFEQITCVAAGGFDAQWERRVSLGGTVRVELRADGIEAMPIESLLADLAAQPVFLDFTDSAQTGHLGECALFTLLDWHGTALDEVPANTLRFTLSGTIAAFNPPAISSAIQRPQIGEPQ